ncbi:MAG: hypothetical protein ACI4MS_00235 [Candidatus Coproplasma sp.]
MVKFDDEKTKPILKRKSVLNVCISVSAFITFACAISASGASTRLGMFSTAVIVLFCIACFALIAFIVSAVLGAVAVKKLKGVTAELIAQEFYDKESLLTGEKTIALTVDYKDTILSVSREGLRKRAEYDLSALKKAPAVYSDFGTFILEFLQGYYQTNSAYTCVTVIDAMDKNREIKLIQEGKVCSPSQKNYFILKGLIR